MKKTWGKPKLIVLYRGRPEENVLAFCKIESTGDTGAAPGYGTCEGDPAAQLCPNSCEAEFST